MTADKEDRCGVGIFSTSNDDPFNRACVRHDQQYTEQEETKSLNRKTVDREFCLNVDKIIDTEEFLKGRKLYGLRLRGYLYKKIACGLGRFFW